MIQLNAGSGTWIVDRTPEQCPLCHHAIDARCLTGVVTSYEAMGSVRLEFAFQCPRSACNHLFVGRYSGGYERTMNSHRSALRDVAPYSPQAPIHTEGIIKLSKRFVDVYTQASAAEAWKLTEIAGCGYRKALEILVKDYCQVNEPGKAETIKSKLLGQVINDHIEDANIKSCARRATWLGNDETHYERRWTDKDIGDLKTLIELTEIWINSHLLTQKYLRDMPS